MILYAWPITPAQHLHAGRSDTQRISGKNRYFFSAPHLCSGQEWGQCYPHNKIHDWTGEALLKNKICTGHLTSVLKYVYYVHTEYLCYRSTQAPSPFLMLCHTLFLFNTFRRPSTDDTGELCAAKDKLYPWVTELQKSKWDTMVLALQPCSDQVFRRTLFKKTLSSQGTIWLST